MDKYYVCRFHTMGGKKYREYKRTKCLDYWVSEEWANKHPDEVWKFSKAGATKICKRENERNFMSTYGEYHIMSAE